MSSSDSQATLPARADLARLLAACYYEPGEEFVEERLFESLQTAAAATDPTLQAPSQRLAAAFAATHLQELRIDYTRLFIGPQRPLAPPYGSLWLEQAATVMQESTLAIEQLYADAGFELAADFRELPDHVAAELEFIYVLLYGEAHALQAGDGARATRQQDWRRQLLGQHVGRWAPAFCATLEREAATDFYRELARFTRDFLAAEAERTRQ